MLDVAVVGGGLCGLALAHSLQARGRDWALFEGRERLGGRVLTQRAERGPPVDLGPAWFWPATQPSIARLVADLGLPTLAQPDDGRVLLLDDPNRSPTLRSFDAAGGGLLPEGEAPVAADALHAGARRVAGGMGEVVAALASRLEPVRLRRGCVLQGLADRGTHVELQLQREGASFALSARRVVLALPPRLAAALAVAPAWPDPIAQALRGTPTWMATAAKAALAGQRPVWRASGLTGNAWVTHAQAVLAEVYDAGPADSDSGALAGFLALDAAQRQRFARGLPMLVESQLAMLFGAEAAQGVLLQQDWATQPLTCSPEDLAQEAAAGHPPYGDARLQVPLWGGRLLLAGSETAGRGGGYLEGALSAAARVRTQLDGMAALQAAAAQGA